MSGEEKQLQQETLGGVPVLAGVRVPRQIIIETDGNTIRIVKADVAGNIELAAIFSALSDQFSFSQKGQE